MDDRQLRETERNIRVNDFLVNHIVDFSGNTVAMAKISTLSAQITKIQNEHQNQLSGSGNIKQNYSLVGDANDVLIDAMRDIRDFANSMAQEVPGLETKFRVPRTGGKIGLIAAARVFADDADLLKQKFMDYGMDESFIDDLRDKADALEQSLSEAKSAIGNRVGATDSLEQEITQTNKLVVSLDPIVRRIYRNDPTNLSAWNYASRVERRTPKPRNPTTT